MQNTQQINWWLEIAKIAIPSVVALVVPFIASYWLSRRMEDYKKELNKELENHKVQLQSDFQMKFYEFQTRYSLLHQRKADAIAKLSEILIDLGRMVEHTFYKGGEQKQNAVKETVDKYHEYIDFYLKNQLYFDDDLGKSIEEVRDLVAEMTDRYIETDIYTKDSENDSAVLSYKAKAGIKELETHKNFRTEFPKLRVKLRDEFRKLLSAEKPE
jgi:hypothetical protein